MLDGGHSVYRLVCFSFFFSRHIIASRCFFLSSGVFQGLRPWRPPLCKTRTMVDRDIFVPAWSSVSIRALVVVRRLFLTSRMIFLASLWKTLRFLPRPLRLLTVLSSCACWLCSRSGRLPQGQHTALKWPCNPFLHCEHAQDADVDPQWAPSSWPCWSETENEQNTFPLFILFWKDAICYHCLTFG